MLYLTQDALRFFCKGTFWNVTYKMVVSSDAFGKYPDFLGDPTISCCYDRYAYELHYFCKYHAIVILCNYQGTWEVAVYCRWGGFTRVMYYTPKAVAI